jgi:hypothetical protein
VDESLHEPRYKAAELNSGTLQHCEILAYNGKVALIEITKGRQGGMANPFARCESQKSVNAQIRSWCPYVGTTAMRATGTTFAVMKAIGHASVLSLAPYQTPGDRFIHHRDESTQRRGYSAVARCIGTGTLKAHYLSPDCINTGPGFDPYSIHHSLNPTSLSHKMDCGTVASGYHRQRLLTEK